MRKVPLWIVTVAVLIITPALFSYHTMAQASEPKVGATADPKIVLETVEVPQYYGYWYFSNKVEPTNGKAGNYGAPLPMAFVFNIENPNSVPILLDGFQFSISFEEFDVNTVFAVETQWIPAGKTNQLRVHAMFDV